jgi:uncharacterized phage protein (TIGR01671 family)
MREILFRGKRKDNGEWVEGYLLKVKTLSPSSNKWVERTLILVNQDEFYEVLPDTVGQYTGLTDKNGKKIFEGDIILFEDECPNNYEYHDCTEMRCGVIDFDCGEFYLTNRIAVEMTDLVYDNKLDGQIVGNIHDHPELL